MNYPVYKLLDWIDVKKLDWNYLSMNPNAIELLRANQDKINWNYLSGNKNAIELLEANKDKIKDKNVATIKVKSTNASGVKEKLTLTATDAMISIEWDTTIVKIPLTW